jgi:hypothetical protein
MDTCDHSLLGEATKSEGNLVMTKLNQSVERSKCVIAIRFTWSVGQMIIRILMVVSDRKLNWFKQKNPYN